MIKIKKIAYLLCLGCLVLSGNLFGQDPSKDVTITTSGSGTTEEKATQNALRSAIEQAFGTFISAKTEILNDELISDEITSVASGNIKSYDVLNASQLPNGTWGVTLKSVVSVDKLTSFVQAKGVEVEVKGGLFALNIKQQILNEQAEIDVMTNMFGVLHESLQLSFDYTLETFDPVSLNGNNENWKIPMEITVKTNENVDFSAKYCIKVLKDISLTENEIESFLKLGKKVYTYGVFYNNKYQSFSFRNYHSVEILDMIKRMMARFYPFRFIIDSGLDSLNGHEINRIHLTKYRELYNKGCDDCTNEFKSSFFWEDRNLFYTLIDKDTLLPHIRLAGLPDYMSVDAFFRDGYLGQIPSYNGAFIVFQNTNQTAVKFNFPDYRSLQEIEQLSQYAVQPVKEHSRFKNGGFVVYEQNGHGLICAPFNLKLDAKQINLERVNDVCDDFVLNGFNDWYLPSKTEMEQIANYLMLMGIGCFSIGSSQPVYWTNTQDKYGNVIVWNIFSSFQFSFGADKYNQAEYLFPVRKF